MKPLLHLMLSGGISLASSVYAAPDPACEPVIKASLARAAQPVWHTVNVIGASNYRMEQIKFNGQSYMRSGNEAWKKLALDFAKAERDMVEQINKGQVKLSKCRSGGESVVEGVATRVINYTVEMPGAPAEAASLHIGKADGLPYAQTSAKVKTSYHYRGVKAPSL